MVGIFLISIITFIVLRKHKTGGDLSHLCSSLAITGNHIITFLSNIYQVLSPSTCKLNSVSKKTPVKQP